jgi:UDP-galactopyranose mutase
MCLALFFIPINLTNSRERMMKSKIKRKVKEIVKEYCPHERTQQRRKNESKAIDLIENRLGRLTKDDITKIMEYLDSDFWERLRT